MIPLPQIEMHVGRSWGGPGPRESECDCPKAPCGLVIAAEALEDCPQHSIWSGKTLRTLHKAQDCPSLGCEK